MQSASDDTEDDRVIITCAKNNDGQLGPRTAWERKNGVFRPVNDFDWNAFDHNDVKHEPKIQPEHLNKLFENGRLWMTLKQASQRLQENVAVGRSAAYEALKHQDGRYSHLLAKNADGLIGLRFGQEGMPKGN